MIPFNKPYLTGKELHYISEAHVRGQLAGDGYFTKKCNAWLEEKTGCHKALLTHSCTAALEMAAILADIQPGDEVIMPSYTFVSTANAFVLRGGVPVFVDIREDTLNIDERLIEVAITPRTKAIVPVHYAGVGCEMDTIMEIARNHNLLVIEDAAQGVMATYKGRPLGSIGDLGCYSFHETAFLWAQMEDADAITAKRLEIWNHYHLAFEALEASGRLRRPVITDDCEHNAHMYYLLLKDIGDRSRFISIMQEKGVGCVFHYVPLHSSCFSCDQSQSAPLLPLTTSISERLVRLPFWLNLDQSIELVIAASVFTLS